MPRPGMEALKVVNQDGSYAPAPTRLEPQKAGPGSAPGKAIRSPAFAGPLLKTSAPPLEPYAVPLRSTAPASAADSPTERGQYCTPIGGQFWTPIDNLLLHVAIVRLKGIQIVCDVSDLRRGSF
jgi:hypothetical protein